GMGVVYEAEQVSLGRRVALKVLPVEAARDAKLLARFRRESQAAAQLHHSNIVPVFEGGQQGDVCFYAMQYIQGHPLAQVLQELRKQAEDRAPKSEDRGSPATTAEQARDPAMVAGSPLDRPEATLPSTSSILNPRSSLFWRSVARLGLQVAEALAY